MMKNQQINLEFVNVSEALRYLRYGSNEPDQNIKELFSVCEKELLSVAKTRFVYKAFELDKELELCTCDFKLQGEDIKRHLSGCTKAILLCVTLSAEVDKLIRVKQIGNMAQATIIDSMASALVEQACDEVEKIIVQEFPSYEFTRRFGLGYGDFPLQGQKKFLNILDAQKSIGVCVNDSLMLTPTKSVTCIIGAYEKNKKTDIAQERETNITSCERCNLRESCLYRKKGDSCGN